MSKACSILAFSKYLAPGCNKGKLELLQKSDYLPSKPSLVINNVLKMT